MTLHPHTLIHASAGTGKTFQLSNRYLALLNGGTTPDQILATTFTRKAAGEILERVIQRLAEAAVNSSKRTELAGFINAGNLSQSRCYELLRTMIQHLHRLQICTLDAFFAQLAGSFSLELGLPTGWTILEPIHDQALRNEAIELTLQENPAEITRLIHLMAKGEARRSVSDLLWKTVSELYNLYLETDSRAWHQIPRPRLLSSDKLNESIELLKAVPLPTHKTFERTRSSDVDAVTAGDWETFIGKGLAAKILAGETMYCRKEISEDVVAAYQPLIKHARAVILDQVAQQTEATYKLLDKFHAYYQRLKHQARAMRFEDVTRSLLGQSALGDIGRQHFRLDTYLNHLLLDEFQDTSLIQWHVLQPLATHVTRRLVEAGKPGSAVGPSFFCVGDGKQAIYGWRGGRWEILDALGNHLDDLTLESLNKSFRSAPPIIEAVNTAFMKMIRHESLDRLAPAVQQWCDRFEEHTTARTNLAGYAELCTAPLVEKNAEQSQADVILAYAADRIKQLVEQAPGYSVGVLVRRNDTVAQLIYELRSRDVPASEEGGHPLTDSPAVQIILSALKLVDHPGDKVSRFHLATSPLGSLIELTDYRDTSRVLKITKQLRRGLSDQGYGPTIYRWSQMLRSSCDQRDQNRLSQLVDLAFRYQQMATLRTSDFVNYVESTGVTDPTTAEVRVMTVHQAKGLQFDIVVLPELETLLVGQTDACVVGQPSPTEAVDRVCLYRNAGIQQLLPPQLQVLFEDATRQSVSEALSVLYVSLTRAVHALHMIIAPSPPNEKKLRKTSAGLLRAALTDGSRLEPLETAYCTGDPDWYLVQTKRAPAGPSRLTTTHLHPEPIRLAPSSPGAKLRSQAPSQLEGGGNVAVAGLLNLGGNLASARGTLIHALFEQITWLENGIPDRDTLRQIAERHRGPDLDVEQHLDTFAAMLELPDVARVLSRSFYQPPWDVALQGHLPDGASSGLLRAEVHNEQRFAARDGDRLMSGFIDRLVLLYDDDRLVAADILDYKTDSIDLEQPEALVQRVAFYRPQLDAYRRGVAHMFHLPLKHVAARLLFLSRGVLSAVPRL